MPTPALVFDLTRLIARLRHAGPSGIDRVDLAYARHVLGSGEESGSTGERFGLVWTARGARVLTGGAARAVVEAIAESWIEDVGAEEDPVYRGLVARLGAGATEGPGATVNPRRRAGGRRRLRADLALRALRASGVATLPSGAVYINTSHMGLERPERFDWLSGRRDMRAVFFVHDLIPLSHPEYGRKGEAERHAARMRTIQRHAAHVLVNSADVGARFAAHLGARGLSACPVTVAPLGVEPVFAAREGALPVFARPTFLICGTIEARKNHLLLLQLWRDLAERHGSATPRLVIVGRRGWEAENVVDLLDRCDRLHPHVVEVSGLSTPGLARLMRGATALLMPSFIEGYGLPIVEAAASGLPVVASDIPVHREVGQAFARLLDPLDGPGWSAAIEALSAAGSPLRTDLAVRLDRYEAPSWAAHFRLFDAALDQVWAERPIGSGEPPREAWVASDAADE